MKNCIVAIALFVCSLQLPAQSAWTQKADFTGGPARSQTFYVSIGNKGYLGMGVFNGMHDDWYEYDPVSDTWSQKASFPGGPTTRGSGFTIGTKCYYVCGLDSTGDETDWVWEYDQTLNQWTQKGNFPDGHRQEGTGFSVGGYGYIGMGISFDSIPPGVYHNDLWQYDPVNDQWTQKSSLPSAVRIFPTSFVIGPKAYVGMGGYTTSFDDFWEYDPVLDSWTQKASYGGGVMNYGIGLSAGGKGYVGTGHPNSFLKVSIFCEYDPVSNQWTIREHVPNNGRTMAAGFSLNGKIYIGTGYDSLGAFKKDLWCYDPASVGIEEKTTMEFSVSPNPSDGIFSISNAGRNEISTEVFDLTGKLLFSKNSSDDVITLDLTDQGSGVYVAVITAGRYRSTQRLIVH